MSDSEHAAYVLSYTFGGLPQAVGFWHIPCTDGKFATTVKPRWLTRFLMKHLMQWEWSDI